MYRSEALRPLSRQHHGALFLAKQMIEQTDSAKAIGAFLDFWESAGRRHFQIEEEVVLPIWARYAEIDRQVCSRVLVDHVLIRGYALRLSADRVPPDLPEIGMLLKDHVRFEERKLFPLIESALTSAQQGELGRAIEDAGTA